MTYVEYQEYMRKFFEQYYQKLSQEEIRVTLPFEEEEKEMWSDDADPNDEWKKWKLVPAKISDEEIKELEKEIGVELPLSLKAFLTVAHHCFDKSGNWLSNPMPVKAYGPVTVDYPEIVTRFHRNVTRGESKVGSLECFESKRFGGTYRGHFREIGCIEKRNFEIYGRIIDI